MWFEPLAVVDIWINFCLSQYEDLTQWILIAFSHCFTGNLFGSSEIFWFLPLREMHNQCGENFSLPYWPTNLN